MAPLPKICPIAIEVDAMLRQGRRTHALALLLAELDAGRAGPPLQALAAKMLRPAIPDGKRGPKFKEPLRWYEIGKDYEDLLGAGYSDTEARLELEERYPREKRTIDKIIAFANKAFKEVRLERHINRQRS